jgi:hypothetical protein
MDLSCLVPTLLVFVLCFLGENIVPSSHNQVTDIQYFRQELSLFNLIYGYLDQ